VIAVDLALLIEQVARSPVLEQLNKQGRTDLIGAAITCTVTDHRNRPRRASCPRTPPTAGIPPGHELFSERGATSPIRHDEAGPRPYTGKEHAIRSVVV
jgi:hypothetical protein